MNKQEALYYAAMLEIWHPCERVVLIVNGVSVLSERGCPIPASTDPDTSWLWVVRCRKGGETVAGNSQDAALVEAVTPHVLPRAKAARGGIASAPITEVMCRWCEEGGAA